MKIVKWCIGNNNNYNKLQTYFLSNNENSKTMNLVNLNRRNRRAHLNTDTPSGGNIRVYRNIASTILNSTTMQSNLKMNTIFHLIKSLYQIIYLT